LVNPNLHNPLQACSYKSFAGLRRVCHCAPGMHVRFPGTLCSSQCPHAQAATQAQAATHTKASRHGPPRMQAPTSIPRPCTRHEPDTPLAGVCHAVSGYVAIFHTNFFHTHTRTHTRTCTHMRSHTYMHTQRHGATGMSVHCQGNKQYATDTCNKQSAAGASAWERRMECYMRSVPVTHPVTYTNIWYPVTYTNIWYPVTYTNIWYPVTYTNIRYL